MEDVESGFQLPFQYESDEKQAQKSKSGNYGRLEETLGKGETMSREGTLSLRRHSGIWHEQ